jgi:hypothetical protein
MAVPKYPCGRCGKRAKAEQMVYSRFSGARYCRDLNACAQRSRRKSRKFSDPEFGAAARPPHDRDRNDVE